MTQRRRLRSAQVWSMALALAALLVAGLGVWSGLGIRAAFAQPLSGEGAGEATPTTGWPALVLDLLTSPEVVEVRSLYPGPLRFLNAEPLYVQQAAALNPSLAGFAVLGVAVVLDDDEIAALTAALRAAASSAAQSPCLWPRHGVRIFKDGDRLDAILGFACQRAEVEVSVPGQPAVRLTLSLGDDPRPAALLDQVLRAQGVTLPDGPPPSPQRQAVDADVQAPPADGLQP